MKVYISADIEGITGVTHWDEAELDHPQHAAARKQMLAEVMAAVDGALEAGAKEIWIKDAHSTGRNIDISSFPKEVKIIREWTCDPQSMMALIDDSFDAAIFIGYHSGAGSGGNPLAHTMNGRNNWVKINGEIAAEFDINALIAASHGVPVVLLAGDARLCGHAEKKIPNIKTVATKEGIGDATVNIAPIYACELIKQRTKEALTEKKPCLYPLPEKFDVQIHFKHATHAYQASFYPGVRQVEEHMVEFTVSTVKDLIAARMFIL